MREYHIISDGTAISTRDELVADDAHCRGCTVHYREHGPYDETPRPVEGLRQRRVRRGLTALAALARFRVTDVAARASRTRALAPETAPRGCLLRN